MPNLRKWSQTASGNATVAGGVSTLNWAEGQNASTVNNTAREMMAQTRRIYRPDEWGWVEFSGTASIASQTTFKLTGDQTGDYTANRRVRLTGGSATRYGSIVSASFTAETTVTITVDSGSLSASMSIAAVSSAYDKNLAIGTASNIVWTGTHGFTGSVSLAGAFALSGDISPAQLTADQDDYAPTGHATASVFRLSSDAFRQINGLAGGADGRIVIFHNVGTNDIFLDEESGTSTAANRFLTQEASGHYLPKGGTVLLVYDATSSRWRVCRFAPDRASQTAMEAGTEDQLVVVPLRQHFHPSACKFWVESLANSTTIELDYNVDSVADTATGAATYTITNDFSSVDWVCHVTRAEDDLTLVYSTTYDAKAAGSVIARSAVEAGSGSDPSSSSGNATWSVSGFGDL